MGSSSLLIADLLEKLVLGAALIFVIGSLLVGLFTAIIKGLLGF